MSFRRRTPSRLVLVASATLAFPWLAMTQTIDLPQNVPAPDLREPVDSEAEDQELPATGEALPLPEKRPTDGAIIPPEAFEAPATPPDRPEGVARPQTATPEPEKKSAGMVTPPEEMACRARLADLGVTFKAEPAEGDASGCSLPFPVSISTLSDSVAIEPPALVNCATAEAAALFVRDHVGPAVKASFDAGITSIRQVSAYVCRPRSGSTTLSEHALGNAIDFGAFRLSDGREIPVEKTKDGGTGRFFAALRSAACGPFKTVLGPGSDADHATHFHFDLAERRGGAAYCR